MKLFNFNLDNYILAEAIKFTDGKSVIDAIKNNSVGAKVDPSYKKLNGNTSAFVKTNFNAFFEKCKNLGIKDTVYGVQFLLGHTNDISLENAIKNDAIYEFLKSYKKPWVKELPVYNKFINSPYNADTWHEFEKAIQEGSDKHGKANKGSGDKKEIKILYPKDSNGWELLIPLSFEGEKAAAFYGKEGGTQAPCQWCTRADKKYYDYYTNDNSHPLYIIRNWKTGKSYQMGFTNETVHNTKSEKDIKVHFLDQNDSKGDEITKGDLEKIPDNLLKLIKIYGTNRNLVDYKKEGFIDPNEGQKGFALSRNKTWREAKPLGDELCKKAYKIEGYDINFMLEKYGRIMKMVAKNSVKDPPTEVDNLTNYANTGKKYVFNYGKKQGEMKYYFEKQPDKYITFVADKFGVYNTDISKKLSKLENIILNKIAKLDLKQDEIYNNKIMGKEKIRDEKNKENYKKKMSEAIMATQEELEPLLAKYKIKSIEDGDTRVQKLPINSRFDTFGGYSDRMPGRLMLIELSNGELIISKINKDKKFVKENIVIVDVLGQPKEITPQLRELCWQVMKTYNRNWRRVFQSEIIGNRQEGNYTKNIYEDINTKTQNVKLMVKYLGKDIDMEFEVPPFEKLDNGREDGTINGGTTEASYAICSDMANSDDKKYYGYNEKDLFNKAAKILSKKLGKKINCRYCDDGSAEMVTAKWEENFQRSLKVQRSQIKENYFNY